jgi:HEPN domain-containing protein
MKIPNAEADKVSRALNSFAIESFRDIADQDYIAARLACRHELFPQFLWSSQQAIEKYLKAILLFNRIPAKKVGHDIEKALVLTEKLLFKIELSERSAKFIELISEVGKYRYLEIPYTILGRPLIDLDVTVWELRRYCQVFAILNRIPTKQEQIALEEVKQKLAVSSSDHRYKFRINGGLLERILDDKDHASRAALIWNNPAYGLIKRRTIKSHWHLRSQNPVLTHFPDVLDELMKYIFLPENLQVAYRSHLVQLKSEREAAEN